MAYANQQRKKQLSFISNNWKGNCDIKNLSRGSKSYLPVMTISNGESFRNKKEKTDAIQVYVPGAKLSLGDLHFSQGDGEISFW